MKAAIRIAAFLLLTAGVNLWSESLNDRLLEAAEAGKPEQVKSLIEQGAGVNARDGDGRTPLIIAAEEGHREVLLLLIESGADIDAMDYIGRTALACTIFDAYLMRLLLEHGADPNAGQPPLVGAAYCGDSEAVELLLDAGADIDAVGMEGTSLVTACMRGHGDIVRLLLERGADPYARDSREGSLYEIAAENEQDHIVGILVAAGVRGPADIAGRLSVYDAPSLPPDEFAGLHGVWYNPEGIAVPQLHAKEVYHPDLTGELYDELEDSDPMAVFTYKVLWRRPDQNAYHVVIDYGSGSTWQDYGGRNKWYGLVRISEKDGKKEWDCLGQAAQAPPEEIDPGSVFYSRTVRRIEGRHENEWLVGTWIYPTGASTAGIIGKEIYNADGTGAIYDLESDTTPLAAFQYDVVCRIPGDTAYRVILTYSPSSIWYLLVKPDSGNRRKESDTSGQNQYWFPPVVSEQSPFYAKAERK